MLLLGCRGSMITKYMTNKEFIDEFIECLESGKDFILSNAIVEGDIDIKDIYERIMRDSLIFKNLENIIEKKDNNIAEEIVLNINIEIEISDVIFKGNFKMFDFLGGNLVVIKASFNKNIYFLPKTVFKGEVNFEKAIFKGKVHFWGIRFEKPIYFTESSFNNADFCGNIFKGKTDFSEATFEGIANFENTIFEYVAYFRETTFKKDADFKYTKSSILIFDKTSFNSIADFRDISFNLLFFVDCIFKDVGMFKKIDKFNDKNNDKIRVFKKRFNGNLLRDIKNVLGLHGSLAIFFNVQFLNKHTKIINFKLSETSFLMTDIRDVMLLDFRGKYNKKRKILSHILLEKKDELIKKCFDIYNFKDFKDKILYDYFEEFLEYIRYESVLAEYRNLRLSIENNRTYEEASDLYKMEMELKKEYSENKFEKFAIEFYRIISNYGESIHKPIFGIFFLIFTTPLILTLVYYLNSFIEPYIAHRIPEFLLLYVEYLKSVLGAKFYKGTGKSFLEVVIYCLYSVLLTIVIGNLYIALRRRLSRK